MFTKLAMNNVSAWRITLAVIVMLTAFSLSPANSALAQDGGSTWYVYSAPFLCGFQKEVSGFLDPHSPRVYEPLVKVANYAFKLDVYNPSFTPTILAGQAVLTGIETSPLPPGSGVTRWPTQGAIVTLPANAMTVDGLNATVVDCIALLQALAPMGIPLTPSRFPFISGMVTVGSQTPLVAWATTTTEVCSYAGHRVPHLKVELNDCTFNGHSETKAEWAEIDFSVSHSIDKEQVQGIAVQK